MPEPKLLEQVSDVARFRHLSLRTEQAYLNWIKRYILFHRKQHPKDLSAEHVRRFLTHLAVQEKVARSDGKPGLSCASAEVSKSEASALTLLILHKSVMMPVVNPSLAHQR